MSDDRFWGNVNKTDSCWLWIGYTGTDGYGKFREKPDGSPKQAHRIAFVLCGGTIPDGLQLDHLCRVRRCVNPAHLEPVTQRENLRRGAAHWAEVARTGRCIRGHDVTDPAVFHIKPNGKRHCRLCHNITRRNRSARNVTS